MVQYLDRGGVQSLINGMDAKYGNLNKVFGGATQDRDGEVGLVPAPKAGEDGLTLCSDGKWKDIGLLISSVIPEYPSDFKDAKTWDTVKYWAEDCASGNSDNYIDLVRNGAEKAFYLPGYGYVNMQLVALNNADRADGLGKAGFTFLSRDTILRHKMGDDLNTETLWEDCNVRNECFGESGIISSIIPEEVKNVAVKIKNPCASECITGIQGQLSPEIVTLEETWFIPSYIEIAGTDNPPNWLTVIPTEGKQFDYFVVNSSSTYRSKNELSTGKGYYWWLRTPCNFDVRYFFESFAAPNGANNFDQITEERSVALAFCV